MKKRAIIIPAAIAAIAIPGATIAAHQFDTSSTPPEIKSNAEEWSTSATVSVVADATFGGPALDYYEYCISETDSVDGCNWKTSSVTSIRVRNSGTSYVWLRAVSKSGVYSEISDYVITKVDRTKPDASAALSTNGSSITVKVSATDNVEIAKYEYAINGDDYVTDGNKHTFTNLAANTEYTIKVRVSDPAGNTKYLTAKKTIESTKSSSTLASNKVSQSNNSRQKTSNKTRPATLAKQNSQKKPTNQKSKPDDKKKTDTNKTIAKPKSAEHDATSSTTSETEVSTEDESLNDKEQTVKTCPSKDDTETESGNDADDNIDNTTTADEDCLVDKEEETEDVQDETNPTEEQFDQESNEDDSSGKTDTFSDFSADF